MPTTFPQVGHVMRPATPEDVTVMPHMQFVWIRTLLEPDVWIADTLEYPKRDE